MLNTRHRNMFGVDANASMKDIKLAYWRLARRYHPDLNGGDRRKEDRFKELSSAYKDLEVLHRKMNILREAASGVW